mmetsp:Transcript_76458/g.236769  ORF Transcript_76458/g.236769 Transcript_76458/m.236769 type:complete len:167 (-) Transcript_76458:35-535(-)
MLALPRLAAALAACVLGAEARVGAKGIFSVYTDPLDERECPCNCCIREPRRPNEIVGNALFKCAMPPANDKRVQMHGCTASCTVVNDPVFLSGTVETNRFCFYHCQPTAGGSSSPVQAAVASQQQSALLDGGSLVDAECVSMRPALMNKAVSSDHNGRDALAPLDR